MNNNSKKKNEDLAKILWQIHSFSFKPYYSNKSIPWNSLKVKEKDKTLVDKTFFREMAATILTKIEKSNKTK